MKHKKIFLISMIIAVILTGIGSVIYFSNHGYKNIDTLQIRILDDKNEKSSSDQIRIYGIKNQLGEEVNIRKIASKNDWVYDKDLGTMSYYGKGDRQVTFELENAQVLEMSILKQDSSGKLEIYRNGVYYKTIDFYSDEWENATVSIYGDRDYGMIIGEIAVLFVVCFIVCASFIFQLNWNMNWKENVGKIIGLWIFMVLLGELIAVFGALRLYPQKSFEFVNGQYGNVELNAFDIKDEKLYATNDDPNMTIWFNQNMRIKTISIDVKDLESDNEWAQAFLENDTYDNVAFFLYEGKNLVAFPTDLTMGAKATGVRIDLVSRRGIMVGVNTIIMNEHKSILAWATRCNIIACIVGFLLIVSMNIVKNGISGVSVRMLKAYLFLINPMILISAVEALEHNPLQLGLQIWVVSYIIVFLVQSALLQILLSIEWTVLACDIGWLLLALVNHYVMIFRGMPLVVYDVRSAGTAAEVVGNYAIEVTAQTAGAVLICIAYLAFSTILLFLAKRNSINAKAKTQKKALITGIVKRCVMLVVCVGVVQIICASDRFGVSGATLNASQVYEEDGFILGFLSSAKKIDKPEGYSVAKVEEILKEYDTEHTVDTNKMPNIIIVMNESFADLGINGDYLTNRSVLPFVNSLDTNVVRGNCHVSVLGGGTSNSEFEALTGNSLAFLPSGTNAYTQYCSGKVYSIVDYLKSLGYECIAEHPCTSTNYNRANVYNNMGFQTFQDASDFQDTEVIRYTSDAATYDKIIEEYEKKDRKSPFFMLDVTMQNHGGYTTLTDWKEPIEILDGEYPEAEEYMSSIHVSDQAAKQLVNYFKKAQQPTLILFFGDHQPALGDGFVNDILAQDNAQYPDSNYITPFFIWANYDIDTQLNVETSTNFLAMLLLDQAGIAKTPYLQFLEAVHEELPVITVNNYIDKNGEVYTWEDTSEYATLLKKYQMVQYAHFVDKSKNAQKLFERN